jgi:hypothetical protein
MQQWLSHKQSVHCFAMAGIAATSQVPALLALQPGLRAAHGTVAFDVLIIARDAPATPMWHRCSQPAGRGWQPHSGAAGHRTRRLLLLLLLLLPPALQLPGSLHAAIHCGCSALLSPCAAAATVAHLDQKVVKLPEHQLPQWSGLLGLELVAAIAATGLKGGGRREVCCQAPLCT